jgi:DNA primase
MKGINNEVIAEVRSRADLHEVIAEFVPLKRAGKEFKGLCPFHAEKSPSFHVNSEKGIFKCFGCGEVGDVFAFIQKIKRLDFVDAVRELAMRYGVQLVETTHEREQYDKRSLMMLLYQQSSQYFSRLLKDPEIGRPARDYLNARGISEEIIDKFKLGYATNSWDGLLNYLIETHKVSASTLEEAGLVRKRQDASGYFDLFRNRLMIPICDDQGRVIAFGGRTLGDDQVKYINSPESPIYIKGEHLFALHQAKEHIKSQDRVIVVEGYFDAITAHQHGFTASVAALGTALTERQAKLLVRYTDSKLVYLCFDQDAAGLRAVDRGVETLNQIAEGTGLELRIISVPGGKDPDECLRQEGLGTKSFAGAIEQAKLLIDWQLDKAVAGHDVKTHSGRIDAAKLVVPILAQIKNSVARGEYVRQWALKLNLREEELLNDVGQYRRQMGFGGGMPRRDFNTKPSNKIKASGSHMAEQQLLALFLTSRSDYEIASQSLIEENFIDDVHQRIKDAFFGVGSQFSTIEDLQFKVMDRLAPDPEASKAMVEVILKAEEFRSQNISTSAIMLEGKTRLMQERIQVETNKLSSRLRAANDEQEQEQFQRQMFQLKQLQMALLNGAKTDSELLSIKCKIDEILLVST